MLQSFRALMTPKVGRRRRPDDATKTTTTTSETPETVAESPSTDETRILEHDILSSHAPPPPSPESQLSIPELYQLLDTQLRVNMGAAVRCGICLCTLTEPIARTPCGHAYCRDCILACLHSSPKCPECNTPITKRSLQPANEFLVLLAKQYKTTLQEFGWTPSTYRADFTTLTQKPLGESDPDDGVEPDRDEDLVDRLHVAATWQHQALSQLLNITPLQHQENQAVVDANIEACESVGYTVRSSADSRHHLPNTQEILDTAREQQVADYELQVLQDEEKQKSQDRMQPVPPLPPTGASLTESQERRRVCFLMDPVQTTTTFRSPPQDSQESLHLSLSPIHRKASLSPHTSDVKTTSKASVEKKTAFPTTTHPKRVAKDTLGESLIDDQDDIPVADSGSVDVTMANDPEPATVPANTSDLPEHTAKTSKSNDQPGNESSTSEPLDTKETATGHSQMAVNTTGLVEDSFGAMHWINKGTNDITSQTLSADDDTDLSLSLTATYDDPSMDYKQKRAALEAMDKAVGTTTQQIEKPDVPMPEDGDKEREDDSQETKIIRGGSRIEDNVVVHDEDSDATADMCSADVTSEEESSDDRKGATRETSKHSTPANVATGQTTTHNDEEPARSAVGSRSTRRRAKSVPDRGTPNTNSLFAVGDIVNVQSRTWSGINKPGGVARISKLNDDRSYNVTYVLGGREANVDAAFISKSDDSGKGKRRETIDATLPAALLRALQAQGFDTTGTVTLEQAKGGGTVDAPRRRKSKAALNDVSNQTSGIAKSESTKTPESLSNAKSSRTRVSLVGSEKRNGDDGIADIDCRKKPRKVVTNTISSTITPKHSSGQKRKSVSSTIDSSSSKKKKIQGSFGSVISSKHGSTQPELSNEEACVLADARYKSQFEHALKKKVLNVVTSGLSNRDTDSLNALSARILNGDVKIRLSDTFGKNTDLCITPLAMDLSKKNAITRKRTAKAMRAALAGIPIVSPAWVHSVYKSKNVDNGLEIARSLPAKTHAVAKSRYADFGVARLAAALTLGTKLPLQDYSIFLCGNFADNRKDLHVLAKEAGATIIASPSDAMQKFGKSKVVLLCSDTLTDTVLSASLTKQAKVALEDDPSSILVVDVQWMSESITCAKALPAELFCPANAVAKGLWEIGNRQSSVP